MIYYNVEKNDQGLFLVEERYNRKFSLKTETVFSQCNGYFGVRASFDTKVLEENRGMFIGGLYQKAYEDEVMELVNCPDLTQMQITLNEEEFSIDTSELQEFRRSFNVLTGELSIQLVCKLKNELIVKIESKRFASYKDNHLLCQIISITPLNAQANIKIVSGINGQITNSGVSHFKQIECRVYDKKYMSMKSSLQNDSLSILSSCSIDEYKEKTPEFVLKRRGIFGKYQIFAEENQRITFTKYNLIDTAKVEADRIEQCSLDQLRLEQLELEQLELEQLRLEQLESYIQKGYDALFLEHNNFMKNMWKYTKIHIKGATHEEEASICFAQYHMLGMMPRDNPRISVPAKGLTGEGYKGHVFWDTEIFVLPFYLHTFPKAARNLLEFRHYGLKGARAKAIEYGYEGAMYPWEVTTDGYEQTPLYATLNIHTGKANEVWSGIKEHHVTADIIYAVWEYYTLTEDEEFMIEFGYEMIFEAAIFWYTRAVYSEDYDQFHILDIIGPDEYTEHINNNAYTNYIAYFCVETAEKAACELKIKQRDVYEDMNKKLYLEGRIRQWKEFLNKLYLPIPNDDNIIPQDDTFLSKKVLSNIDYYKNNQEKQSILYDYSRDEIVNMQVLKQADVVMLLNLFPHLFPAKVVKDNVIFYESRTIHDSSLSYCAHSQACARIGETDLAWDFFVKSMEVDLNDNPCDSTDGVHSASLGGIYNCVIFGFAGVSHNRNMIEISPKLPKHWKTMEFYLKVRGVYIKVEINDNKLILTCESKLESIIKVKAYETEYELLDYLEVSYK